MEQQNANVKSIPPSYGNKPWTAKLLKALSAAELKKLIALYGVNQINARVAINAQRGIK